MRRKYPKDFVLTAIPDDTLEIRFAYLGRVWLPVRRRSPDVGGRRRWREQMFRIYDVYEHIRWPDGTPFTPPEITEVFRDEENRWHSSFIRADATGRAPHHLSRKYERLRLYALYCDLLAFEQYRPLGAHRLPGTDDPLG